MKLYDLGTATTQNLSLSSIFLSSISKRTFRYFALVSYVATITSTTRNPKPQITKSKEQMRRDALRNLPGNRKAMRY